MKVLLTGGTGFVGGHILSYLSDEGVDISLLGRSSVPNFPVEKYFKGNIDEVSDYSSAFSEIDVVIHSAARAHVMNDLSLNPLDEFRKVNTKGTLNLAKQAAAAGVKRFIFISSIKVNGEKTTEDTPFRHGDPRLPEDAYGQSKSEAEEQLLELVASLAMDVVIIRPPLIYGPGVKANFRSLMKLASMSIPLPFGNIKKNKRSLVSVFNLADLIKVCLTHKNAANKILLVSDDRDVSTGELFALLKASFQKKNLSYSIPEQVFWWLGRITGKKIIIERLCGSLCVDISETKSSLGWEPPVSLEKGLSMTTSYFYLDK